MDAVILELRVAGLFDNFTMPSSPSFTFPSGTNRPLSYTPSIGAAPSADAGLASANRTLTAILHKSYQDWEEELDEDAAFAIEPWLTGKLIESLARGFETQVINGDTTGTHMDNDVNGGASDLPQKSQQGLRHIGTGNQTDLSDPATLTLANINTVRNLLDGPYKVDPSGLVLITSPAGLMLHLLEVAELQTLDKIGPQAVVLTGQVGSISGMPVVVSSEFPEDLDNDGVNKATPADANTHTALLCVHTPSYITGTVRNERVDFDFAPKTGTVTTVASMRMGFLDIVDTASENTLGYGYNLTAV